MKDAGIVEQVKTFDTIDVLMAELAKGSVDAVINDLPVTQEFIKRDSRRLKLWVNL